MLWLLAKRIAMEEFKQHAPSIHEVWKDFILDEKLFPRMVNLRRAKAMEELKEWKKQHAVEDSVEFEKLVPEHLKSVLSTKQRREFAMFRRMIQDMDWPDVGLWEDIAMGFQTHGDYKNGEGLEPDPAYTEAIGTLEEWLEKKIVIPKTAPTAWDDEVLKGLAKEIEEKLIQHGHVTEISESELLCNPARCFPKVEIKFDGSRKIRILVDERNANEFRQNRFKAKLNGSRQHVALLDMFAVPPGYEEVGWVPAHQSRRDLWKQCMEELHRLEQENVTTDTAEILREIRRTMGLVHRPKAARGRHLRWLNNNATTCVVAAQLEMSNAQSQGAAGTAPENTTDAAGTVSAKHVQMVTKDWSGAYYQVGVRDPRMNPITWYDPEAGRWRFGIAKILNMGSKFSVPSWCRVANFVEAAAARYGRVIAPIYIDDAAIFGTSDTINSARDFYEVLSQVLGLELSAKADANQESSKTDAVRLLGLDYVFDRDNGTITVEVPENTLSKVRETGLKIQRALTARALDRKDLEKFTGGLTFIACSSATRAGMELIRPLHEWNQPDTFRLLIRSPERRLQLRKVVDALLKLIDNPKWRVIGKRNQRKLNILITDASGQDKVLDEQAEPVLDALGNPVLSTPQVGAMLWTADGTVRATRYEEREEPSTPIAVLEARAVALGLSTWSELIKGQDVLVYLDNQNAAYNFVRAGGKSPGTARIATDVALWGYWNDTRFFYQYIRTDLNPADALTRESWDDLKEALGEDAVFSPVRLPDGTLHRLL